MKRLLFAGIILFSVLFSSSVRSIGYTVDTIDVASFYLEDRKTSRVIVSRNRKTVYPAASTVKLVTAMVARQYLKGESIVRIPREAEGIEPTKVYLRRGERFTARDLISAIIIKSANDAAVALAVRVSGSEKKFTGLMNRWCRKKGIKDTYFADSSGISPGSVSNAENLTRIFKIFISNKENLKTISRRKQFIKSLGGRRIKLINSNNLYAYRDETGGVLVGKTGFTKRAGYCFTGIVYYENRSYFLTVMGANMAWHGIGILMNYANEIYREKKI